jgi:protein gp37
MAETTIEWTDKVWNPVTGCRKISPGCANCYAANVAKRFWGERQFTDVRTHEDRLRQPLHWKKPSRVFVNSMSDLFHDDVPDAFIVMVFTIMESCPQHTFQILTKRPERMSALLSHDSFPAMVRKYGYDWLGPRTYQERGPHWRANVWLGVSVEDQARADERIPLLIKTPAAVRFLSIEPLLGPVDLTKWLSIPCSNWQCQKCHGFQNRLGACRHCLAPKEFLTGSHAANKRTAAGWKNTQPIDWVIAGGESGSKARPMHPAWPQILRDECQASGVPFFFKQWGEWGPVCAKRSKSHVVYIDGRHCDMTKEAILQEERTRGIEHNRGTPHTIFRVGKKVAGRLLDGREWNEFPQAQGA